MSVENSEKRAIKFDEKQIPYIDLGKHVIRLEKEEPTKEDFEKAERELRETPENIENGVAELRALVLKESHLHVPTDDEYMQMFLRPCKYYPESAMKRINYFFQLSHKYGPICENVMPAIVRHVFEQEILQLLPLRDQHGRRILVLQVGKKWKPSKCPLNDIFKAVQLAVLASMVEPRTQINGSIAILDMENLPISHVMQFTPSFANMVLDYIQDCLSIRLKAVHVVNNSYIFNMIFAIFKPFIKEKLRKRIFFHGKDWSSLTKHVDKNCLPQKYGGALESELPAGYLLADMFEAYKKDFEMANSYGFTKNLK